MSANENEFDMKQVRENPPIMVKSFEQMNEYKTLYDDIVSAGVSLQYSDRHGLGQLACILVEIDHAQQEIMKYGEARMVNGDKGNQITKRNPARDALDKLRTQSMRLMKEFKMTPSSRGRVLGSPGVAGLGGGGSDGWEEV